MEEKGMRNIGIQDLPECERPRERLAELGETSLSTAELLAILLRVGVEGKSAVQLGQELMATFSGLRGLHAASFDELCAVNGMGPAKTAQIKAAIELGYRLQRESDTTHPRFTTPESVYETMQHKMRRNFPGRTVGAGADHAQYPDPQTTALPRDSQPFLGAHGGNYGTSHPGACRRHHPGAQPSLRRPSAQPGRYPLHGRIGPGRAVDGYCCARPHHHIPQWVHLDPPLEKSGFQIGQSEKLGLACQENSRQYDNIMGS